MVAAHVTDEQLRQLDDRYQRSVVLAVHQNDSETYKAFMAYDSRLHLFIFQFAGNNRLLHIYRNLNAHMQFVRFRLMNHAGGKLPTTDREHKMILQALRKRDPEKAKQAIRNHLLRIDAACAANPQQ